MAIDAIESDANLGKESLYDPLLLHGIREHERERFRLIDGINDIPYRGLQGDECYTMMAKLSNGSPPVKNRKGDAEPYLRVDDVRLHGARPTNLWKKNLFELWKE